MESCNPRIIKEIFLNNCHFIFFHTFFVPILVKGEISDLEAPLIADTITEAFFQDHFIALLTHLLSLPNIHIVKIIQDEGIENASELSKIDPNKLKIMLNNINKAYGSSGNWVRIYFSSLRIRRIKGITTFLRRCLSINIIRDIRLILIDDMNKFVEYMEVRQEESKGVDHIISSDPIKFHIS